MAARQKKSNDEGSEKQPKIPTPALGVIDRSISTEMRESYLDYAMSVITARALPDVRDGLKPVHRRILFSMHQMGLTPNAKFRKSATVVGDVLGKYHPHGDASVYDAMTKMAQDFMMRYPLALGQGNFGSIDGDPPAAMRYTEAKMSRLSLELIRDIEKETVDWRPNYDASRKEPSVFPSAVPNLLLNGTLGIAVGMATNIPPHNLREVVDATIHLIDEPSATNEALCTYVKGPDFPTGGLIFNEKEIRHAYASGKGGIVNRGEAEINEDKKGNYQIVITSIPYRVNKATLLERIADLVREKKLEGIKELRDESTRDIRIVVGIKSGAHPQNVLNYLYKHTELETVFHINAVALVDGIPQTLSLKGILEEFIAHRKEVVRRRTEFDLAKARDREHILLGLKKALDHIDEIIQLIKKSKNRDDAKTGLMQKFKFSDRQAEAILVMQLQRLSGLERKKIEDELREVQAFIAYCEDLLKSVKKMLGVIKDELKEIVAKFGDDRKTKLVRHGVKTMSMEDLVPDEEQVLVLTAGGYIKRTNPAEYRVQKRGGVGAVDLNTKEEDFVTMLLPASTHSSILFFTNKGKAYQTKMYEVPEGKRATRGKSIMNFLAMEETDKITSVLALPKGAELKSYSLFLVTREGTAKKVAAESFADVRRSGLLAIKLDSGDELMGALLVGKGDTISLTTSGGQSIRFKEGDIREMGRQAAGVRAMKLSKGDAIVGADVVSMAAKDAEVLVLAENGYGKRTKIKEYKIQKRGGSGIKTSNVSKKTGKLITSWVLQGGEGEEELVVISKKGVVIRTPLGDIPTLSRATQGVRIMKLREGDSVASFICL